jgi:UDP-glucose 4-epimerase
VAEPEDRDLACLLHGPKFAAGRVVAFVTDRNALAVRTGRSSMDLSDANVLITGGAGLVGSHLASELLGEAETVRVIDDLSKGDRDRIPEGVEFVRGDVTDPDDLAEALTAEIDVVFHFAAYTDTNYDDDRTLFEENTEMTYNVLERMSEVGVDAIAFTSSSTVYGEAPRPTPEDYAPLAPISIYGSSKLADEALLSTYAHSYGMTVWNFRFANIVGPHQRGNVVPDFIEKLQAEPGTLTILGDGRQEKSYLHVSGCVDAIRHVVEHADDAFNVYNLGTRTTTSVTRIADIVSEEMGLDPDYEYTGGDRGWTGDVPKMRLSIEKLSALGWEPSSSSDESVRRATRELIAEIAPEHAAE